MNVRAGLMAVPGPIGGNARGGRGSGPGGATGSRGSGWIWPVLICGLIGLNMSIVGVTVYCAVSDRSFAIEPDYYQKATGWDASRAEQARADKLGWEAECTLRAAAGEEKLPRLVVTLSEPGGGARAMVKDASVEVEAFAQSRSGDRQRARLLVGEDGRYAGPLAVDRAGLWEIRVTARRGETVWRKTMSLVVSAGS